MTNDRKKRIIGNCEISFTVLIIFLTLILYVCKIYANTFLAYLVLVVDIYYAFKFRNNRFLFFLMLGITYFDYSVVISKYIFDISDFSAHYKTLKYIDTKFIGISSLLLLHLFSFLPLVKYYDNNIVCDEPLKKNNSFNLTKYKKVILYIMLLLVLFIIVNNRFFKLINLSEAVLEYTLIPIIIITYYFRENKIMKYFMLGVVMLYSFSTLKMGGRVTILEPLIAIYLLYFSHKINYKKLLILFFLGIFSFTIAGLYGDNLVYKSNTHKYTDLSYVTNLLSRRKFALDTSYSAYWTGMTIIDYSHSSSITERITNFSDYIIKYSVLGTIAGDYTKLPTITHQHYVHYYGGYINSYFYYWLGYGGIVLIGLYLGVMNKNLLLLNKHSSDFKKIVAIYYVSTLPRWYMYEPTALFRGIIFVFICYVIVNLDLFWKK